MNQTICLVQHQYHYVFSQATTGSTLPVNTYHKRSEDSIIIRALKALCFTTLFMVFFTAHVSAQKNNIIKHTTTFSFQKTIDKNNPGRPIASQTVQKSTVAPAIKACTACDGKTIDATRPTYAINPVPTPETREGKGKSRPPDIDKKH